MRFQVIHKRKMRSGFRSASLLQALAGLWLEVVSVAQELPAQLAAE